MQLARIARIHVAHLPSALAPLSRRSHHLGGGPVGLAGNSHGFGVSK